MTPNPAPSREDVLDAFAVESNHDRATVDRYLREYPQFADDLIELLHELGRVIDVSTAPLSAADQQLIAVSWQQIIAAGKTTATDLFAQLGVDDLWRAFTMVISVGSWDSIFIPRRRRVMILLWKDGRLSIAASRPDR